MNAYNVGQLLGAFVITFLLTRLVRRFTGKDYRGSRLAFLVVVVLSLGVFSFGANSFEEFQRGAWSYLLATIAWLVADLAMAKRKMQRMPHK